MEAGDWIDVPEIVILVLDSSQSYYIFLHAPTCLQLPTPTMLHLPSGEGSITRVTIAKVAMDTQRRGMAEDVARTPRVCNSSTMECCGERDKALLLCVAKKAKHSFTGHRLH